MVPDFKNVLFPIIESFQSEGGLTWADTLKDLEQEDLVDSLETIHDTVKNICYHAALLPGIDESERERLIGKLLIAAAHLFHSPGRSKNESFDESMRSFEQALKSLARPDWIKLARERFDEFEKAYEIAEKEGSISPEQVDYLRPVFFALDIFEILTFEPNEDDEELEIDFDEDEDDYENEEEEFEQDDEDEE